MKNKLLWTILAFLSAGTYSFGSPTSDTTIIKSHLTALTKSAQFRNYKNIEVLNKTADFIK